MASNIEFINFVCERLNGLGEVTYKKMFGEYMVYVNSKPVITVCDNIAYVKILKEIEELMVNSEKGYPYNGAKEHYILDIENEELTKKVISILEQITPIPKKRKKAN